jgi:hypothetical protein
VSVDVMEERVGQLEGRVGRIETSVALLGSKQDSMSLQVGGIDAGVRTLLEREAKRPEPTTWKNVGGTLAITASVLGSLAVFVWWFIEASPSVRDLEKRVMRLDDPEVGRVIRLEKEAGWTAKVYVEK